MSRENITRVQMESGINTRPGDAVSVAVQNIERINNTVYIAVYHDTDRGSAPVCMIEVELNTQNPDADNEFSVAVTEAASAFTHQHYIAADESQRR